MISLLNFLRILQLEDFFFAQGPFLFSRHLFKILFMYYGFHTSLKSLLRTPIRIFKVHFYFLELFCFLWGHFLFSCFSLPFLVIAILSSALEPLLSTHILKHCNGSDLGVYAWALLWKVPSQLE